MTNLKLADQLTQEMLGSEVSHTRACEQLSCAVSVCCLKVASSMIRASKRPCSCSAAFLALTALLCRHEKTSNHITSHVHASNQHEQQETRMKLLTFVDKVISRARLSMQDMLSGKHERLTAAIPQRLCLRFDNKYPCELFAKCTCHLQTKF